MDIDAWSERAAIMEFDGGLSCFQAETKAAEAQGYRRWEMLDAIRNRNFEQPRDHGSAATRNSESDLPRVQPASAQEI